MFRLKMNNYFVSLHFPFPLSGTHVLWAAEEGRGPDSLPAALPVCLGADPCSALRPGRGDVLPSSVPGTEATAAVRPELGGNLPAHLGARGPADGLAHLALAGTWRWSRLQGEAGLRVRAQPGALGHVIASRDEGGTGSDALAGGETHVTGCDQHRCFSQREWNRVKQGENTEPVPPRRGRCHQEAPVPGSGTRERVSHAECTSRVSTSSRFCSSYFRMGVTGKQQQWQ